MGYIDKNLIAGEQVLYKTRLHSIAVLMPILLAFLVGIGAIVCFYIAATGNQPAGEDPKLWAVAGAVLAIIAAIIAVAAILKRNAMEMAVTNRRVLIKAGILSRRTIELLLSRIESIIVTESFFGRMLGYGTVVIRGTGGTPEPFPLIAHPIEFRRHVQEQIEAGEIRPAPPQSPA